MRRYDEDVDVRCISAREAWARAQSGAPRSAREAVASGIGRAAGPTGASGASGEPSADPGGTEASGEGSGGGAVRHTPAHISDHTSGHTPGAGALAALVEADESVPDAFVRAGRLYVVRAVLDRWVERRPWWRTVLDDAAAGRSPALTQADLEDPVWRVEAAPGRLAQTGVYDLVGRPGGPWRLRRVGD